MLYEEIRERLEKIDSFINTFINELEPKLPKKFPRGPVQREILKIHNLPYTGVNQRLVNEAMSKLGYKKIMHNGWSYYRLITND